MKRSAIMLFILFLLPLPVFSATPSAIEDPVDSTLPFYYVALGDSITVGYEPGMVETSVPYGFVDRLYEQALFHDRTVLTNYGILGLTSKGLAQYVETIINGSTITPEQLDTVAEDPRLPELLSSLSDKRKQLEQANLITLSIGGNDFNQILPRLISGDEPPSEGELQEIIQQYGSHLDAVISQLTSINPAAQFVIMEQYQPYPRLNLHTYTKLNQIRDQLSQQLHDVVAQYDVNFDISIVPIAGVFEGKELIYTHITKQDTHPNQLGYEMIAQAFAAALWGEYSVIEQQEPVTIIVGGQQLDIPYQPQLIDGTVFIPLREYTEALGAAVDWQAEERSAYLRYQGQQIILPVQDDQVLFDEDKIFLPLRWFTEQLNMDVQYIHHSKTVFINQ